MYLILYDPDGKSRVFFAMYFLVKVDDTFT